MSFQTLRRALSRAIALALALQMPDARAGGALLPGPHDAASMQAADALHDRFIVRFRDAQSGADVLAEAGRRVDVVAVVLRETATGAQVVKVDRLLEPAQSEDFLRMLRADSRVAYAEPDQRMHALYVPNDPAYPAQWGYDDGDAGIRADRAWDIADGSGAVVAVLDTGITAHRDLDENILPGYDFIHDAWTANDGNGRDPDPADPGDANVTNECGFMTPRRDSSWHGTHVAGTIAAVTNNVRGVAGTARGAMIVPLRVLGRCGGYTSDIADAIVWASGGAVPGAPANAFPADVINLSLGGWNVCGVATQEAIDIATANGTALAVAAGNYAVDVAQFTPANCKSVIAVAATTPDGTRAYFSNYGEKVDIAAPGLDVFSTINLGLDGPEDEGYASYSGTSMAAPHVAGVIALVQSVSASPRNPAQLEALLKANVRAFPVDPARPIGSGILDARSAIDAAMTGAGVLSNGVPKPGLAGIAASERRYSIFVPRRATHLQFALSEGSGDADLYVRRGAPPGTANYDCKSAGTTTSEICHFDASQGGIFHVLVRGYATYTGVSLLATHRMEYGNFANVAITDHATVSSAIRIIGRKGNAPADARVTLKIRHGYRGDLQVDLVAPNGTTYLLSAHAGSGEDNIFETLVRDLSGEPLNGTWKLRVYDWANGDEGFIDSWRLSM